MDTQPQQTVRVVRFGVFEAHIQAHELRKGGLKIKIHDQPFQVLAALLEHPGEIVTREELHQRIWPADTFVDFDHGLNTAVNKLRDALGDSADSPRFVETVPRRGYRWIAPVESERESAQVKGSFVPTSRRHLQRTTLALSAIVIALAWGGFRLHIWLVATRSRVLFQKTRINGLTSTGRVTNAVISPDGKYLAYVAGGLWVSQVGTASNIQLSPPIQIRPPTQSFYEGLTYSYEGLTFSHDGNVLYYLQYDSSVNPTLYETTVLGGAARKVIVDVMKWSRIALSPDGKRLAFTRSAGGESAVFIANVDGTGERKLIKRRGTDYFSGAVAWSPDGKTIACGAGSGYRELGQAESVLAISAAGGQAKALTSSRWHYISDIVWLPAGRGLIVNAADEFRGPQRIWHLSYPDGKVRRIANDPHEYTSVSLTSDTRTIVAVQHDEASSIWIAPKGGAANAKQITAGASRYDGLSGIAWTPDNRIVYGTRPSGNFEVWIMNADGSNRRQLARDGRFPRVSQDARHIIFTLERAGVFHIGRVDIDGNNPEQLTNGRGEAGADCSPDGKWLVYSAPDKGWTLWKAPIPEGPADAHPVQLNQSVGVDPSISPDGKMIAFNYIGLAGQPHSDASPKAGTAVIPFEGGPPIRLIDGEMPVHWTADGSAVLYVGDPGGVANIWRQPIAGGRPKQLTDFKSEEILAFDWSKDGKQLAIVRAAQNYDAVLIRDQE